MAETLRDPRLRMATPATTKSVGSRLWQGSKAGGGRGAGGGGIEPAAGETFATRFARSHAHPKFKDYVTSNLDFIKSGQGKKATTIEKEEYSLKGRVNPPWRSPSEKSPQGALNVICGGITMAPII